MYIMLRARSVSYCHKAGVGFLRFQETSTEIVSRKQSTGQCDAVELHVFTNTKSA